MVSQWTEVGDRVFVRRYTFFDQNIVAVLADDEALIVDTRTTHAQARELLDDLRALGAPPVGVVVNTHGHYDHAFGNRVFRPAPIWGHSRCVTMLERTGERQREGAMASMPDVAADLSEVVIDPPDRTFLDRATLCLGDREVELTYLGRGHTDNDIIVRVPDADALCAGDLLENGAVPFFGDGFPMDGAATAEALLALVGPSTVVVPGHGDHAGLSFVESSLEAFRAVAAAGRRVQAGEITLEDALDLVPYPAAEAKEPISRAVAQLRGELDG
jgi:glyoxylase-like metal-dependent hydrolase (beta-lactamase superfamily II)